MSSTDPDPWDPPDSRGAESFAAPISFMPDPTPGPSEGATRRFSTPEGVRYRPLQLLGRGGMGHVTEVHDMRLDRNVALKHRRPDASDGARLDAQLARESAIAARLDHPGIVPVLDAGLASDGLLYYTMPIVQGQSLATALSLAPSREHRLRYLRRVLEACEAVAWAHRRGIAHGDLKPSNIMLAEGGGTRVLDWGLARVLAEPAPAATGGTPQYMSPEQAQGAPADEHSDVWSLGAILFEVAAGRPLRAPGSAADLIGRARSEADLEHLDRVLDRELAPELVTILYKALAPRRVERYPDAGALADDLASFLDGRRVTAHAYSPRELLVRLLRAWRVPLLVALAALLIVIALVFLGMQRLASEAQRAERAKARAEQSETHAKEAFESATDDLARSLVSQALMRRDKGARAEAEILAANALLHRESPAARGVLASWGDSPAPNLVSRTELPVCRSYTVDDAGERLLCREESALSAWAIGEDAAPTLLWRRAGAVHHATAAGHTLAVLKSAVDLQLLDASSGALESEHIVPCEARLTAFAGRVVTVNNSCFWSVADGERLGTASYPCVDHGIMGAFAVDPGRERWAAVCEDGTLVQGAFGEVPSQWTALTTTLVDARIALAAAFSDDMLAIGSGDGDLVLVDLASGHERASMPTGFGKVVDVAVSHDDELVLVRASSGAVGVFEPRLGLVRARLPLTRTRAAFLAGDHVVVIADDMRRYRLSRGLVEGFELGSGVTSLTFDPAGRWLAATSGYRLEVRRSSDGARLARETGFPGFIKDAAVDPTGAYFHLTSAVRQPGAPVEVRSWQTHDWDAAPPTPHELPARHIAALADGSWLMAPYKGGLRAMRSDDAQSALWITPFSTRVADLATTPDGRFAVALTEGAFAIQRVASGTTSAETIAFDATARTVAIARDGVLIATAGDDGIHLWDADRGALIGLIAMPRASLTRVAISPDMRWLAAGSLDGGLWLWHLSDRRLVASIDRHTDRVSALAFSPDSRLLASGGWDGQVHMLGLDTLTSEPPDLVRHLESAWGLRLADILDDEGQER